MVSISVLIVTYNQQDTIERAINSVLVQKEWGLKRIIICDDCSKDNNWNVINNLQSNYPEYIKCYRNNPNLGIYGNFQKLISLRENADLYYILAGDDVICNGLFEKVQNLVVEENVNMSNPIGFFFDFKTENVDGSGRIFVNSAADSSKRLLSLYIRGLITWRSSFFTEPVLAKFKDTPLNQGLNLAESIFDSQFFRFSEYKFYRSFVGSIYYTGVGVSSTLSHQRSAYHTTEALKKYNYFKEHFDLSYSDRIFIKSQIFRIKWIQKFSLVAFVYSIILYCLGMFGYPKQIHSAKQFIKPLFLK